MQYYTRLQESPSLPTLAMLEVNPTANVEVIPMDDRYGRTVTVRTVLSKPGDDIDAVYICAGDNPVFIANVIVLAHAHNIAVAAKRSRNFFDGV